MKNENRGTLPFCADYAGHERRIVYTPKRITVELAADGTDVTGSLTRDELKAAVDAVKQARARYAAALARRTATPKKDALEPYVSDKPTETVPDYKALFGQAMHHLRIVSGSRNSFTSDATDRLFDLDHPTIHLRTPQVEAMHNEAHRWLTQHEHLVPKDQPYKED